MSDDRPLTIDCGMHGVRTAAVVCGHMVGSKQASVGFIENSSDLQDLQAWCAKCEAMFLREGDKTEAFRKFNRMAIVCVVCYQDLKARHSRPAEA